jgi:hypothetical protein
MVLSNQDIKESFQKLKEAGIRNCFEIAFRRVSGNKEVARA